MGTLCLLCSCAVLFCSVLCMLFRRPRFNHILSGLPSVSNNWVQIMSQWVNRELIWAQPDCNGYQQMTPVGKADWIHDNSSKDTSSNTTFGRIRQLVECNVWSKWAVGLNLYFVEMCLKFV